MKKIFNLICFLCVFAGNTFAQKQKPTKEKPPTAAEMKAMMKEAQAEMDKLDPETKRMMDSMGIKIPKIDAKNLDKITDKQIAKAFEDNDRIIPKKDAARIAKIFKNELTDINIVEFLNATHNFVVSKMKAEDKKNAEKLLSYLKAKNANEEQIEAAANGLWLSGKIEIATFLFGKASLANSKNVQIISNYAAVLSNCGGEQYAIPILNKLNKEFKNNSTILNNLGQAWLGLGDAIKSEKYLDSCIRLFANHPQANAAKSAILENKGNKNGAVVAMKKSIKQAYSAEKESKLKQLGLKTSIKDYNWNFAKKVDGLGLGNFTQPKLPMNTAESYVLEAEWESFINTLDLQLDKLRTEQKQLAVTAENEAKAKFKTAVNMAQNGKYITVPYLQSKASKYLSYAQDEYGRKMEEFGKTSAIIYANEIYVWEKDARKKIEESLKKEEEQSGEGMPNKNFCEERTKIIDDYLFKANTRIQSLNNTFLTFVKTFINETKYYGLYTAETDVQLQLLHLDAKIAWLGALKKSGVFHLNGGCIIKKTANKGNYALAKFEDLNCESKTEFNIPFIGTSYFNCRGAGFELEPGFPFTEVQMPFKIKYDATDIYTGKSTIYISKDFGADKKFEKGPFSITSGAKAEVTFFIEMDGKGISDAGVTTKSSIDVSATVEGVTINEDAIDLINQQQISIQSQTKSFEIGNNNTKISINSGFNSNTTTFLGELK